MLLTHYITFRMITQKNKNSEEVLKTWMEKSGGKVIYMYTYIVQRDTYKDPVFPCLWNVVIEDIMLRMDWLG